MVDIGSAVGYLLLDTTGFSNGLNSAWRDLQGFTDNTSSATDRLSSFGSAVSSVGGTLTKSVTLPLAGAGTAIMKIGNDFESQMSRVQAIAGATGTELEALTNQALELGSSTSFSASEVAQGMENLASAGFTTNEIMSAMPGLLDLAASSGAELGTASEIAASAIRGFGLEATDAGHVADVFAEAAARTNAQTEDMGEAMKYIAPVANAMGQSLEETAAAIGIMSDAGIKGSQAGTSLRGALSRLAKPTDVMYAKMEELGLSFYDAQGNMLPLNEIVSQLQNSFVGLTQEQQNNALVTLFGQESLSGMLALIQRGPDELVSLTESFKNCDGAAAEMAETMLDNTSGSIEEMMGAIETLAIKLQQVMAPVITKVVEKITEFVEWLGSLDEGTLQLIATIAAVAAAVGPVLIVIGNVIKAISTIGTAITSIISIVKTVGTAISGLFTLLAANPVGLVIAAIAALIAIFVTLWNNCEAFREFWIGLWEGIKSIVSGAVEAIKGFFSGVADFFISAWDGVTEFFSGLWEGLKGIVQGVADFFIGLWTTQIEMFKSLWSGISEFFSGLWEGIKGIFSAVADFFIDLWTKNVETMKAIWGVLTDFFSGLWEGIKSIFSAVADFFINLWTKHLETMRNLWDTLVGFFTSLWEKIKGVFSAVVEFFQNIFTTALEAIKTVWSTVVDFFQSIWDAIKAAVTTVTTIIKDLFIAAWDAIKAVWDTVAGFFQGVGDAITSIFSVVTEILAGFFQKAADTIKEIWTALKEFFSKLWDGIKGIFSAAVDFFKGVFQKAYNAVTSVWEGVVDFFKGIWDSITGVFSNVWEKFKEIGSNIVNGIKDGIMGAWSSFTGWLSDTVGGAIDSVLGLFGVGGGSKSNGSYASGLDYVPKDGLYTLHRGEAVLTKEENQGRGYGGANGGGGDTYNFYSPKALDPITAAREMKKAKQQLALGY